MAVALARAVDFSPAQLAIAWLGARAPAHISIIGARNLTQLSDNFGAADLTLDSRLRKRLDWNNRIALGFPSDFFLTGWPARFGDWPQRLDRHFRPAGRRVLRIDDDEWPRHASGG
ncbi:MAG: aldo/keto reductase [Erythrobacter sp.]|nr:aldo/keto reductase [Erythrobacter sp.]